MSNPTPCLWNVRWDCPNMTETELRVQLAKKLGWKYHQPESPWVSYWIDPNDNSEELPSLYDLCQQGEERLTTEQQSVYLDDIFGTKVSDRAIFAAIRLSNLPERARALCEVL